MVKSGDGQRASVALSDGSDRRPGADGRLPRIWVGLSSSAALLSIAGCRGAARTQEHLRQRDGRAGRRGHPTGPRWLVVVGPLLLILGVAGARGSLRAWLSWLGLLSFTAYNYAIYTFSVHFGPLFLVWVAVLGLSLFALIGGLMALEASSLRTRLAGSPARLVGWYLIAVATLFILLWLSEIVPDLLADRASTSAADWNVPTNPVHVLDLAIFLPGVIVSGVLLLRRHWFGYATVAAQLAFLGLTCLPVLVTPPVAEARGHTAGWPVILPIGVLALATLLVLWRLLRTLDKRPGGETGEPS
jgi:hypothetical protein